MSDWGRIKLCDECGAGNPADVECCVKCNSEFIPCNHEMTAFEKYMSQYDGNRDLTEYLDFFNSIREPAIGLKKTESKQFNKIGGLPSMPSELIWPVWNGKPLAFLCQFDLSQFPHSHTRYQLPATGLLYFFYDQEQTTWGFDPKDVGGWHILYTSLTEDACVEQPAPEGLDSDNIFKEQFVSFTCIDTYPSPEDERIQALNLMESKYSAYCELCSSVFPGKPMHQFFGHQSPIQGNYMNLDCQLASHGIYCGDSKGYRSLKARFLDSGKKDWILLFQLDSDEDSNMMWGDCGRLYFWIKKDDLKTQRFDKTWMIFQCY